MHFYSLTVLVLLLIKSLLYFLLVSHRTSKPKLNTLCIVTIHEVYYW